MKKLHLLLPIVFTAIFSLPYGKSGNGLKAQIVTTLAGSSCSFANGTRATAGFTNPSGIASDGKGNLYVTDAGANAILIDNRIRKVVISTGVVTTFAGSGATGHTNSSTDTLATFNNPAGLVTDGNGNLFVADAGNNEIRMIVISTGYVSLLAGSPTGASGYANGTGTAAKFNNPTGVTTDGTNLYVADYGNNDIRKIVISSGAVTLFAGSASQAAGHSNGSGAGASFDNPYGITYDGSANLFVADANNDLIRQITPSGVVTTLAGEADSAGHINATGTAARFYLPYGVAVDGIGNLYVADQYNNEIRKIVISTGVVSLVAGSSKGDAGYVDATGSAARFNGPYGVTSYLGNLYVPDNGNCKIRQVEVGTGIDELTASHYVSLFPNPASQNISLKFTVQGESTATVKVMDVTGREVMSENTTISQGKTMTMDVSQLADGIYFVKVIMNNNTEVLKFIKQ